MTQYRYQLDKSSKKFHCPECGKKRFVQYIDNETGEYTESHYGRCDREQECAYHLSPMNTTIDYSKYQFPIKQNTKPSKIKMGILNSTLKNYEINPMVQYLYSKYDREKVNEVVVKYKIGTANLYDGSIVYWQIDDVGDIRSGKIMPYDKHTGKRSKNNSGNGLVNWVHSVLNIPDFNLKQCLYGLHLLKNNPKTIALVESEKTSLIMSLELPQYTWMATGSNSGFKHEYLEPLKNIAIVAYPDKGEFTNWEQKAKELNVTGFNIRVSNKLENIDYKEGWDLVDAIEYEDTADNPSTENYNPYKTHRNKPSNSL